MPILAQLLVNIKNKNIVSVDTNTLEGQYGILMDSSTRFASLI